MTTPRRWFEGRDWLFVLLPTVLALLVVAWGMSAPNMLAGVHGIGGDGYDDGVHLGTALRLTQFALPYRDFVFLHPPGISWMLLPAAIIGRVTSEQFALVLSRVFTAGMFVADVALVAMLLRRRGRWAMVVGGLSLALWPFGSFVSNSAMAEAWVGFFLLLGCLVLFDERTDSSRRRQFVVGALLGVALSIKILAVLPIAAILLVRWVRRRRFPGRIVAGGGVSLAVLVLPFVVAAPVAFVRDVIVTQLLRRPAFDVDPGGFADRVAVIFGWVISPARTTTPGLAVFTLLVFVGLFALALWWRRSHLTDLDLTVAVAMIVIFLFLLRTPDLFTQYPFLLVVFGSLGLGIITGALADRVGALLAGASSGDAVRWILRAGVAVTLVVVAVLGTRRWNQVSQKLSKDAFDPSAWIAGTIPAGSCVVFDVPTLAIVGDRFVPDRPCSDMVDPFGSWLVLADHSPPRRATVVPEALRTEWDRSIATADAVILSVDISNFVAWTGTSRASLNQDFSKVRYPTSPPFVIYRRK